MFKKAVELLIFSFLSERDIATCLFYYIGSFYSYLSSAVFFIGHNSLISSLQREQSDYSIVRHQVESQSKQSMSSDQKSPIDVHTMRVVVTDTPNCDNSMLHCIVISCSNTSISVGTQALLCSSRCV